MEELACWLALARAPVTNRVKAALLDRCPSIDALYRPGHPALKDLSLPPDLERHLRSPDLARVDEDREWLESSGSSLLHLGHPAYPPMLAAIDDPPVVLYVRGDPDWLAVPQLAVVGSRNPTPAGRERAANFAGALAELGLGITSGLAVGIDTQAHKAAIAAGAFTVAVAGNGLDRVYPACNSTLAEAIGANGALISEFPPGSPPVKTHFPQRNRLISGLSLGVLVVEAALRSGSLITARLAAEQGREVFALPGSIENPLSRGCHRLIRDGAKLVECVADIVCEIAPMMRCDKNSEAQSTQSIKNEFPGGGTKIESGNRILRALGHDPASIDTLVERTGLTADVVSSILLALEMDGHVSAVPGGLYSRATGRH